MSKEQDRLDLRIATRRAAREILSLVEECAVDSKEGPILWEEIRDAALVQAPLPPVEPNLIRARPMTDAECREFEKEGVPFGKFAGHRVGEAGLEYLRWLSDQTFIDQLRKYLANETISRQ